MKVVMHFLSPSSLFPAWFCLKPALAGVLVSVALCACQTVAVPAAVVAQPAAFSAVQITALKDMGFRPPVPDSSDWALDFLDSKLLFNSADDALSANGRVAVTDIAKGLLNIGITRLRVEGHTDSEGGQALNQALSARRAEYVVRQLIQQGFTDGNIQRIGFGLSKPIASNTTPEGRAQNRRVTLIVIAE